MGTGSTHQARPGGVLKEGRIYVDGLGERRGPMEYAHPDRYWFRCARTGRVYSFSGLFGPTASLDDIVAFGPDHGDDAMDSEKKHEGLPVAGYRAQSAGAVHSVNANKEIEERVLRLLDHLAADPDTDKRWLAAGRTQIELGFMAVNRAVFKPARVQLPEDGEF
jgi:hypothetical protein